MKISIQMWHAEWRVGREDGFIIMKAIICHCCRILHDIIIKTAIKPLKQFHFVVP